LRRNNKLRVGEDVWGRRESDQDNYSRVDISQSHLVKKKLQALALDYIFYLAGLSPQETHLHPEQARASIVDGLSSVLQSASTLSKIPRVLVISSSYVYGAPRYLPIDEMHPLDGKEEYAILRQEQEKIAVSFTDRLSIVIARSFNHTGPGQPDTYIIPKICEGIIEIKKGLRKELIVGNLAVKRDISDVRDVVRAYRLLLENEEVQGIYNVCRGSSISLKEVIEYGRVRAHLDQVPVRQNKEFLRENDPEDICGSNEKLKKVIAWQPEISYEKMLEDIFTYGESC
jgi:GDP-4-dehydro-6-deoxy-D-mannose reductase